MKQIGHLKIKSLYTRLIEQRHPEWKGHPIVIVGVYQQRSPVLAVSDEGKRMGIVQGQPLQKVLSRIPDAKVALADRKLYDQALAQIKKRLAYYSPVIEQPSYSSSYIDLTGTRRLWGQEQNVLYKLEKELESDLGTPAFSGLAINKLVSKTAADQALFSNEKLIIVPEGEEKPFLSPNPTHILPDIQQDMLIRLRDLNLLIVGDVQKVDVSYLKQIFGLPGQSVHQYASGIDDRLVTPNTASTALTEKIVFQEPTNDGELVRGYLFNGLHRLCQTLRSRNLLAGKFKISLQFADHQTDYRQLNFPGGIHAERLVYEKLERLLAGMLIRRVQVGLMVITADRLFRTVEQLLLWDTKEETREDKIFKAIDRLELKYGHQLVKFAGVA